MATLPSIPICDQPQITLRKTYSLCRGADISSRLKQPVVFCGKSNIRQAMTSQNHKRRSSVNFGRASHFCPKKYVYEKLYQLPEYYTIFARKIFFFRVWGARALPTPRLLRLWPGEALTLTVSWRPFVCRFGSWASLQRLSALLVQMTCPVQLHP